MLFQAHETSYNSGESQHEKKGIKTERVKVRLGKDTQDIRL